MPEYEVTDNITGKTLILSGEGGPPTEAELHQIFGTGSFQNLKPTEPEMMGARPATFEEKYVDPVLQKIQPFFPSPRQAVQNLAALPGQAIRGLAINPFRKALGYGPMQPDESIIPNVFRPSPQEGERGPQTRYEGLMDSGQATVLPGPNVNPALVPTIQPRNLGPFAQFAPPATVRQPNPYIEGTLKAIGAPLAGLNQLFAGATSPEAPLYINPYTRALMVAGMIAESPENVQQAIQNVKGPSDIPKAAVDVAGATVLPVAIGATLGDYGSRPTGIRSEVTPQEMAQFRAEPKEPYRGFPEVPVGQRLAQFSESTQATQARRSVAEEQARRSAAGEAGQFPLEGMPFVTKEEGQGPVSGAIQTKLQSGIDPDTLRTAIKVGGRLLVGLRGESHRETLERYGYSGEDFPFEYPGRGYISTDNPNEFLSRQQAEQGSGLKGTADLPGGGLDSSDLPGINMAAALRIAGYGESEIENALRELRTSNVSQETPPGNIQEVGEEVRTGAETQSLAREAQIQGKGRLQEGTSASSGKVKLFTGEYTLANENEPAKFVASNGDFAIVSKEPAPGSLDYKKQTAGPWRITYFTKAGEPYGHESFNTWKEAYAEPLHDNRSMGRDWKEISVKGPQQSLARLEPQAQARREEVAPVSTPMGMGRSLKNLVNVYLGRRGIEKPTDVRANEDLRRSTAAKAGNIPILGKAKLEDLYPDELVQAHNYLKGIHEERLKQVGEDEKGEVARDMENTLWQEIRNKFFSLGLKKGENVTGASLEDLQRERERIQSQLDQQFQSGGKKLQDKAEQALMRDLQGVTELIKKQGEGGTKLYSGISIQPVVDLLKKVDNDRKTLFKMASLGYRKVNDQVFAKRDAVDNAPLITANRAENHLDLTATKDFGKDAEQADKAVIAVLAGRKAGLNNLATLVAGKNKEAEAAVKFAGANSAKLQNLIKQVEAIDAQNVAMAKANGVHIPTIEDYLKQAYKTEDEGLLLGRRGGPGIGLGSKLPRKYPNIFEAIADGKEPISLSAKALVGKRTAEIQREINQKLWLDSFRTVTDKDTKQPIVTDLKHMGPTRPSMPKEGYSKVEGLDVGIHKGYEPLFITATGKSIAEGSRTMQAALQAEGGIKHGTLAFDFYHLFRVAMLGGRAGVGVRGLPFGSMGRRGVSLLDYSAKDLAEAVRQGKAPPEAVAYQNETVDIPQGKLTRREVGSLAVRAGLNVGKHSEALYTSFVREFPGLKQTIGKTNRYIFDTLSRGVAYEGFQIEFERLANANPKMPAAEVARNVARDINFRLGNIGRQGLIKSQSMQDLTSLIFLAPRWVESMGQSEVRAAGQVGKALGTLSPTKVGTLGKSTATLVGAFFIATQALNYVINGHSTFDNPNNKGHEVDLWIPPLKEGEKGFHVSPFSVPMELTHDMLRYTRAGQSPADALARIAENKLSPLAQGVGTFLTGKNYRGEEVDRVKGALGAALNPLPLPIRQGLQSAKEKSLAPFERQTFSLLGVKAEPETFGEQRSREAEGKDLIERAVESGVRRVGQPQKSPAERLLAETASSRSMMKRGTEVAKTLSKADQNWLTSRGLFLPGFDNKVKIGGESVNLTEKEMTRYTELVKTGYEEAIKVLRDNYDEADSTTRQKLFSSAFTEARKAAREQLIQELISEFEKDRKGRKFKALQ